MPSQAALQVLVPAGGSLSSREVDLHDTQCASSCMSCLSVVNQGKSEALSVPCGGLEVEDVKEEQPWEVPVGSRASAVLPSGLVCPARRGRSVQGARAPDDSRLAAVCRGEEAGLLWVRFSSLSSC